MLSKTHPEAQNDSLAVAVYKGCLMEVGLADLVPNVYGNRAGMPAMLGTWLLTPETRLQTMTASYLAHLAVGHHIKRIPTRPGEPQWYGPWSLLCLECYNRASLAITDPVIRAESMMTLAEWEAAI